MLVACWSPKGGVGKSVVAAALALCFQEMGHPTLLIDLDPQKADLATLLQSPARPSILDWPLVAGGLASLPDESLVQHPSGLRLLPGPSRLVEEGSVGKELTERLLDALAGRPEPVVLDVCGSLRDSTLVALERADTVLLMVTPDLLSLRCVYGFLQEMTLMGLDAGKFHLVINRAGRGVSTGEIAELIPLPVLAELPSFPPLAAAVNTGNAGAALERANPFSKGVGALARALLGDGAGERRGRPGWFRGRQ